MLAEDLRNRMEKESLKDEWLVVLDDKKIKGKMQLNNISLEVLKRENNVSKVQVLHASDQTRVPQPWTTLEMPSMTKPPFPVNTKPRKSSLKTNKNSDSEKVATPAQNTTQCPDCNGTVSKRAKQCPHCGGPLFPKVAKSVESREFKIIGLLFILIAIGCGYGGYINLEETKLEKLDKELIAIANNSISGLEAGDALLRLQGSSGFSVKGWHQRLLDSRATLEKSKKDLHERQSARKEKLTWFFAVGGVLLAVGLIIVSVPKNKI